MRRHARYDAACVLDADDRRDFRKARQCLGLDVGYCPSGDVVNNDRKIAGFGEMRVMRINAILIGTVIIRCDDQRCCGARCFRECHMANSGCGIIRSATGDDRHTAIGDFDAKFDYAVMLFIGQRGAFAGRSAGDERRRALANLPFDEAAKSVFIDVTVPKRCDQCRNRAGKHALTPSPRRITALDSGSCEASVQRLIRTAPL